MTLNDVTSNGLRTNPLLRGLWRLSRPVCQPAQQTLFDIGRMPVEYVRFVREFRCYKKMGGAAAFADIAPHLLDRTAATLSGGGEYFFQDIWALKQLRELAPVVHHDFGSRIDGFVGQATAITEIVHWDIRRPNFELPGLRFREGNLTALPLEDGEIESMSCLHTVEHVGLGRYGDPIDPSGTERALGELERVLAPGGQLIFSMPVGRDEVCFNAQRRWPPLRPIETLSRLRLISFSAVDASGAFRPDVPPESMNDSPAGCGLYLFRKDG